MTLLNPHPDAPAPRRLRIAVVGSGISGLAAAHRVTELAREKNLAVTLSQFESSSRVGGVFGSEQIGEYLIERGADSFITDKPAGIQLCRRLGLEDQFISTNADYRRSLILHRGRTVATPEGFNLLAPARMGPMLSTPLLSWSGKLRLLQERFIPRRRETSDESLASFVRRRLGQEMLDRIVQPMVGGIYTSDPEQLSLQATLPRFIEMERKYGSLIKGMKVKSRADRQQKATESASGARYGLFVSLKNGMQQLLDTLEQRITEFTNCRPGRRVVSLEKLETGWRIESEGGRSQEFDGVVLAIPAHVASGLMRGVDPALSTALGEIQSASSAIVVSGHSLNDIKHPLNAFGLVIPHCEGRRILAASFLSRKFSGRAPAGKVIIRTFVGGAMQPEELEHSDDRVIETVLLELKLLLGVNGQPDFAVMTRYSKGMPQYTVGHLDRVAAIEERARMFPTLAFAGNYFRGVGVPDCIHRGERAAEELMVAIQQPNPISSE